MCVFVFLLFTFQGWSKHNAFHVCITSYNIAVQDHRAFKQKKWKYLILDEVGYRSRLDTCMRASAHLVKQYTKIYVQSSAFHLCLQVGINILQSEVYTQVLYIFTTLEHAMGYLICV